MVYRVLVQPRASKEIDALHPNERDRVLLRIRELSKDLQGDVKQLKNFDPKFRLRVGDYRVLFNVTGSDVIIYRVVHRSKAY